MRRCLKVGYLIVAVMLMLTALTGEAVNMYMFYLKRDMLEACGVAGGAFGVFLIFDLVETLYKKL